ncbi:hypothetical protein Dsin_023538 [Dipteronia sinensis]|uniref:Reverse transcriptase domain-containing protein n=1 Tax=Dipteronia sinensis TaxID=43782 RepID=A0AAE0E0V8_9ROSI|nr:hypothetical protein Dsin_023538 [Dipteronia sinensis]
MIRVFGFSEKWISLIMRCVESVTYSFLINGEVCGNIKPSRGLRQGDPLSLFLFLFCTKGLSNLIQQAQKRGTITSFRCNRDGPAVTHLFFANDSLLFTKANEVNCVAIRTLLEVYANASGQVINFNKSAMCVSPSYSASVGERLVSVMGITLVDCHENYLGIPCFTGRNKRNFFANIVDSVWAKIKGWGEKLLSVGGKEVLLKVVIQAISTYAMSIFRLPKGLISEIQRLCAGFWWGSKENQRKIHWCTWNSLCKPKDEGGLGFRDLKTSNRALLAKQAWRILKNPESLAGKSLKGVILITAILWMPRKKGMHPLCGTVFCRGKFC